MVASRFLDSLPSPIGQVGFDFDGAELVRIAWRCRRKPSRGGRPAGVPDHRVLARWLDAVLSGEPPLFPGPWRLEGTAFQLAVWRATAAIPVGEVVSYGELASQIGHPGAARAVGTAMGKNPLPLLIPCHRVVSASGMGGFTGGLAIKRFLLDAEGVTVTGAGSEA